MMKCFLKIIFDDFIEPYIDCLKIIYKWFKSVVKLPYPEPESKKKGDWDWERR